MSKWIGKQDAFGREMYDYYMGQTVQEIAERDDGWITVSGGPPAYMSQFKDWPEHQKKAISLARGRVLDVGCGAGRVGLYLQGKGLDVLGIDNSALAIKVCKLRGLKKAKVLPITQASRKLGLFDTIMMYGNNFGLFENFKRARWLLRRFYNMTNPGARIIAESNDPYKRRAPNKPLPPGHLAYHRANRKRGRMSGQVRIRIRHRNYATPWFDYLLVSKDEMRKIVDGTGWKISRSFDSKGSSYIAVLEKEQQT